MQLKKNENKEEGGRRLPEFCAPSIPRGDSVRASCNSAGQETGGGGGDMQKGGKGEGESERKRISNYGPSSSIPKWKLPHARGCLTFFLLLPAVPEVHSPALEGGTEGGFFTSSFHWVKRRETERKW